MAGIDREPTQQELNQGEELKQSLLELHSTMVRNRIARVGLDIGLDDYRARELVVLPSSRVTRLRVGTREDEEGEFRTLKPVIGWTQKPFVLAGACIAIGYGPSHWIPDSKAIIRGESPSWHTGDRVNYFDTLSHKYTFELAKHSLALMANDQQLD